MRYEASKSFIEGGVAQEDHHFSVGDPDLVISILRDKLYSDKPRVVTQEYICNARDANREVGKPDHEIDVYLPNSSRPIFGVRDYGPGLSRERIANVFVQFGRSTKRHTDQMTGGFGIGAKSAWCYSDSFNVTSFQDGKCRTYLCHLGVTASGTMSLLSEEDTDQPNGVLIEVPIKADDVRVFFGAAMEATRFWPVPPKYIHDLHQEGLIKDLTDVKHCKVTAKDGAEFTYVWDRSTQTTHWARTGILIDSIWYQYPQHSGCSRRLMLNVPPHMCRVSANRSEVTATPEISKMLTDFTVALQHESRRVAAEAVASCKKFNEIPKIISEAKFPLSDWAELYGNDEINRIFDCGEFGSAKLVLKTNSLGVLYFPGNLFSDMSRSTKWEPASASIGYNLDTHHVVVVSDVRRSASWFTMHSSSIHAKVRKEYLQSIGVSDDHNARVSVHYLWPSTLEFGFDKAKIRAFVDQSELFRHMDYFYLSDHLPKSVSFRVKRDYPYGSKIQAWYDSDARRFHCSIRQHTEKLEDDDLTPVLEDLNNPLAYAHRFILKSEFLEIRKRAEGGSQADQNLLGVFAFMSAGFSGPWPDAIGVSKEFEHLVAMSPLKPWAEKFIAGEFGISLHHLLRGHSFDSDIKMFLDAAITKSPHGIDKRIVEYRDMVKKVADIKGLHPEGHMRICHNYQISTFENPSDEMVLKMCPFDLGTQLAQKLARNALVSLKGKREEIDRDWPLFSFLMKEIGYGAITRMPDEVVQYFGKPRN